MEKAVIELKNGEGEAIYVETQLTPGQHSQFISAAGDTLIKASSTFEAAMRPMLSMTAGLISGLEKLEGGKPDTVELEFGITLSGEVSAWVITANGEGSINLKMTWNNTK